MASFWYLALVRFDIISPCDGLCCSLTFRFGQRKIPDISGYRCAAALRPQSYRDEKPPSFLCIYAWSIIQLNAELLWSCSAADICLYHLKKMFFFVVKLDSPFYLQNKITLTMQMNSSQFRRLSQQVVQMNFHLKNEFLCKVGTKANFLPKHLTNWRPFAKIILLPRKHSYTFRQSFAMTTGIAANSEGHRHLFARNLGSDFQA